MGNILEYPRDKQNLYNVRNQTRGQYTGNYGQPGQRMTDRKETSLQSRTPVILPFNSFDIRPDKIEETHAQIPAPPHHSNFPTSTPRQPCLVAEGRESTPGQGQHSPMALSPEYSRLDVETTKISSTPSSVTGSAGEAIKRKHNYIKRYRNEEEKLIDLLNEKDAVLKSAIHQGQILRAKCNRFSDELESVKQLNQSGLTENQWKKKYFETDKKYRDVKEQFDVLVARNKNGRDFLEQQKETIDVLNLELQRERLQKQQLMSNSLSSLHSLGVTDKNGRVAITQLTVDNRLLQERLDNLETRNQRGREYLSKIEAENRECNTMITKLKSQLLQEKAEKDKIIAKYSTTSDSKLSDEPYVTQLYAKVDKTQHRQTDWNSEFKTDSFDTGPNALNSSHDAKSFGFELDEDYGSDRGTGKLTTAGYEEIEFSQGLARIQRDDDEEEFVIEAELEPEEGDKSVSDTHNYTSAHKDAKQEDLGDEIDAGYSSTVSPYEPVRVFDGEVITRF